MRLHSSNVVSPGATRTEIVVDGALPADAWVLQSLPDFGEGTPAPFVADVGASRTA